MPARLNLAPPLRSMANLAEDFFELRRRRFDRWLKELASGVDEEPSVRVFVMGGGSGRHNRDGRLDHGGYWRSAVGWPLPQTRWTRRRQALARSTRPSIRTIRRRWWAARSARE